MTTHFKVVSFIFYTVAIIQGIRYVIIDIMMVAIISPRKIAGTDFFILIPISAAISAPVHAPVPGNGIATKKNKPQNTPFSIFAF